MQKNSSLNPQQKSLKLILHNSNFALSVFEYHSVVLVLVKHILIFFFGEEKGCKENALNSTNFLDLKFKDSDFNILHAFFRVHFSFLCANYYFA